MTIERQRTSVGVLPGVQYLRGIAAILVVLKHSNGMMRYPQYFGQSPTEIGVAGLFGVAIFFTISGFIMAVVALDPAFQPKMGAGSFLARRFVRIMPFMWLAIIGYNLLSFVGTAHLDATAALRALVLWPIGSLKPNITWTLRHELIFYLIFALTMLGAIRMRILLVLWFVSPILLYAFLWLSGSDLSQLQPDAAELVNVFLRGSDTGANLQFGVGFLLGYLYLQNYRFMRPMLPFGPLLPLLAAVVGAGLVEGSPDMPSFYIIMLETVLAGIIVWAGIIVIPTKSWAHIFASRLGDASYSIYLTHNAVLLILLELVARIKFHLPELAYWVLFVVTAVATGLVVYYVVEKPLVKYLQARVFGPKSDLPPIGASISDAKT